MRIHHLNCSTFCPYGGQAFERESSGFGEAHLICHCLLIETYNGLVLVDTGLGMKDIFYPEERFGKFLQRIMRPKLKINETAVRQIRALGFHPSDVRHIILTHLDFDHAGGIDDFPNATVHVMDAEVNAATHSKGFLTQKRYAPAQLTHAKTWQKYYAEGEKWFGFDAVRKLEGLPEEILLVPLIGHSEGHTGVAVNTDQGWLLHAGDAYYFRGELNHDYSCPPGLRGLQKILEVNHKRRMFNQMKLRDLAHSQRADVRIFCSHDKVEFEDLKHGEQRLLAGSPEAFENVLWMKRQTTNPNSLH